MGAEQFDALRQEWVGVAKAPSELEPERLVTLLGREEGSLEAKLEWLVRELPNIELLADVDHPDDPKRRLACVRSRVLRHYRQHRRSPAVSHPGAPIVRHEPSPRPTRGDAAESAQIARERLFNRGRLRDTTPEAFEAWERAGRPTKSGWWEA